MTSCACDRRSWRRSAPILVAAFIVGGLGFARAALAGPVRLSPNAAIDVQLGTTQDEGDFVRELVPLSLPGSVDRTLTDNIGPRGTATLDIDLSETANGTVFDLDFGVDGQAFMVMESSITTDRPVRFTLFANPVAASDVRLTVGDVTADAFRSFDVGTGETTQRGSLARVDPVTGDILGFEAKTFEGELAPGTHEFSLFAAGVISRNTPLGSALEARVTFTDATVNPIPLPPAAWAGMVTLAGAAAGSLLRCRRRGRQ